MAGVSLPMELSSAIDQASRCMGMQGLKPKQLAAVESFVSGKDTFVALPTGYGKSIIFAILPLLFDFLLGVTGSIVVVVTPLISLMIDQKEKFMQRGIKVEFVGEAQKEESATTAVLNGDIQLVYISPESLLLNRKYRNMLTTTMYQEKLRAFVVDEAHCVRFWGDEFRTAFADLGNIRGLLPSNINIMALTATATKATLAIVKKRLAMQDPVIIGLAPDRPNIKLIVERCPDLHELCGVLAKELLEKRTMATKTVVFCRSLQNCAKMCIILKKLLGKYITEPPGIPDSFLKFRLMDIFTAASDTGLREEILAEFCKSQTNLRLIIASSAFGLGVDCKDIVRVINYGTPNTLEELVQETGRAGRNGHQAEAILYHKAGGHKLTDEAKSYGENQTVCRRSLLFNDFLFYDVQKNIVACKCCDLCALLCTCKDCNI